MKSLFVELLDDEMEMARAFAQRRNWTLRTLVRRGMEALGVFELAEEDLHARIKVLEDRVAALEKGAG